MIKAYVVGLPSLYEGEDIEIRYGIFREDELLWKESILSDYKKPAVVGQFAFLTLLKKLEKEREDEILVLVKEPALLEIIKGTSSTKNVDVIKMSRQTKKAMEKFGNLIVKDISKDKVELMKWKEILTL